MRNIFIQLIFYKTLFFLFETSKQTKSKQEQLNEIYSALCHFLKPVSKYVSTTLNIYPNGQYPPTASIFLSLKNIQRQIQDCCSIHAGALCDKYHKVLHLECCSSPRSASNIFMIILIAKLGLLMVAISNNHSGRNDTKCRLTIF